MQIFIDSIGFLYLLTIIGLALYGLNSIITVILYIYKRQSSKKLDTTSLPKKWPAVTIQLPIYNEKYTVTRLMKAVTELDYPMEKLQIQILDDSTDDTIQLVSEMVSEYKLRGMNIVQLHRDNREGYKAGALSYGLKSATGELIAIFDADFVP